MLSTDFPNIATLRAAAARLNGFSRLTPLLENPLLNARLGRRVLFKAECLQHTGAFKYRGAHAAISALSSAERQRGVLAYSSGNHAHAVARVAREFKIPAVIVMPADAPALKIASTRAYDAEVMLYDRQGGEDREAIAREVSEQRGLTLIPPYDHPEVIAGQGSCGLEMVAQCRSVGVSGDAEIWVPCGGGGLCAGITIAMAAEVPRWRVRPVEPVNADDVCRSLQSGQRERLTAIPETICDAIITPSPGKLTFPILYQHCAPGLVVSDEAVLQAMATAMIYLKVAVEPGGAVALAAALQQIERCEAETLVVVLSGGNVDPPLLTKALSGDNKPQLTLR